MRPSSYRRTNVSSTAADRPASIVKRSRDQSPDVPSRRIWFVIVEPDSSFHAHTRSMNFVAAEIVARFALRLQLLLDDDLRGDAGVVGAELPQRVVALHPVIADEHVHQRLLERVPHVQRSRDVRRGKLDAERRRARGVARLEVAARLPHRIPLRLDGVGLEAFREFHWTSAPPPLGVQKLEIVAESRRAGVTRGAAQSRRRRPHDARHGRIRRERTSARRRCCSSEGPWAWAHRRTHGRDARRSARSDTRCADR